MEVDTLDKFIYTLCSSHEDSLRQEIQINYQKIKGEIRVFKSPIK